jgi:hypothetical protein
VEEARRIGWQAGRDGSRLGRNVAASSHMTEPPTVKFPGIDIELSKVMHDREAVSVPVRAKNVHLT